MTKAAAFFRARAKLILFWVVVVAVGFAITTVNRNRQAGYEAAIENPATRDATVADLVRSGSLLDVLSNSEDPTGDSSSDISKRSNQIREDAAKAVDKLAENGTLDGDPLLTALFSLRKDSDSKVKDSGTAGLVTFGKKSDANLTKLATFLKDGDPDVRGATVDALAAIGGPRVAALADSYVKDETAQDSAVSVLAKVGKPAIPLIEARLNDPVLKFRLTMVDDLRQIGDPSTIPTLLQIANDQSQPSMRRAALTALTSIVQATLNAEKTAQAAAASAKSGAAPPAGPSAQDVANAQSAEPVLIGCLQSATDDGDIRAQAALTLGSIGGPNALKALTASIADFDTQISDASRDGLARIGAPAVDPLTGVLRQGSDNARIAAAQALGAIAVPSALSALDGVMNDPATPDAVRRSAIVGLGLSGNPAVIPTLVTALGDRSGIVADAASSALLDPALAPKAVQLLIACFTKTTPIPFNASQTLSQMGVIAVQPLEEAAKSPNTETQTWAAVTLGRSDSHDPTVAAALTPLASSPNGSVRFAATEALQRLQGS